MKKSFVFKKIITSFLILTTFFVSSFSMHPSTVNAQLFSGSGNANGGVNVQGLTAVVLNCGVSFFAQRKAMKLANRAESLAVDGVSSSVGINIANPLTGPTVPVSDKEVKNKVTDTETETQLISFKEECLDLLARYVVLKIITKISLMTVEWINSGFDGNPFYPENRENFFEQLAQDEVTNFTAWFSASPEDYPFGRIISETILLSVQSTLQNNLRFSLNQVLQNQNQYAGYESFQAQFSVGGWAGYSAFAQPNNNVFGNYLMAQNHLAGRTAGSNYSYIRNFQEELRESGGLLNQRICRLTETGDPADEYFDRGHEMHMGGYSIMPANGSVSEIIDLLPGAVQAELADVQGESALREMYNYFVRRSTCRTWETVTPGRLIAEQTSEVLGSPLRNLELADEMNENLGLIFDALAAQLFEQGLRRFQNSTGNYSSDPNSPNYNALWAQSNDSDFGSNSNQPTLPEAISGDGVNPGLIQLQQDYLILAEENIEKISEIIRDIRALDYCVPGPNPRWYQNAYQNITAFLPSVQQPFSGNSADDQAYYANVIEELTGVNISPTAQIGNANQFNQFMVFLLNKYSEAIDEMYSLNNTPPPSMRPTAANLYNQISTYQTSLENYQNQINALAAIMPQLSDIQTQLLSLPSAVQNDPNSPEMQAISSLFSQVASQGGMINQSQYTQAQTDGLSYNAQTTYINGQINSCIAETSAVGYAGEIERITYPFQTSILENQLIIQNIANLAPNAPHFIEGYEFGSGLGPQTIDISTFGGGIQVQDSPASAFADFLQTIF